MLYTAPRLTANLAKCCAFPVQRCSIHVASSAKSSSTFKGANLLPTTSTTGNSVSIFGGIQAPAILVRQPHSLVTLASGSVGMATEQATLGGGCFWCIEACYNQMKGVHSAISGYTAGQTKNPTYKQVCEGNTGHAEIVQVTFDPTIITYKDILEIFFTLHDPTTLNRQGNDAGTQYRSIICHHSEEQKRVAQEVMDFVAKEGWYKDPLVTQLEPVGTVYPAEDYHQAYYVNNPGQGYCRMIVGPKVAKFRSKFAKLLKD